MPSHPRTHSEYRCSSTVSARPLRRVATAKPNAGKPSRPPIGSCKLDRRAHVIAETVLTRDNGIASRSLSVDSLSEVFRIDPDTLHGAVPGQCSVLAAAAGSRRCRKPHLPRARSTALVVSTCTGYLCPGLTSYVIERLGLRTDVLAFDLVGQGCAAALPNWRLADALLAAGVMPARLVHLRRSQQCGDVPRQRSRAC